MAYVQKICLFTWAQLPTLGPYRTGPKFKLRAKTPAGISDGCFDGGAEGTRTPDPLNAIQVLSQLSYSPTWLRAQPGCPGELPLTNGRVLPGQERRTQKDSLFCGWGRR